MQTQKDTGAETLATLSPSLMRRGFAYVVLVSLGLLMIYLGFAAQPPLLWLLFLIAGGGGVLAVAEKLRRGTQSGLVLKTDGIYLADGSLVAHMDTILRLDRGTFAFKPSHGFLLTLTTPGPRIWRPGLIWRMGRRIGVGGVTGAGEGRFMAEIIIAMIAERGG